MTARCPQAGEFSVQTLLHTSLVIVRDVGCRGTHAGVGAEERAGSTQLVFPYRGVYVRHVGHESAVADANQVLLFNEGESYRVSHPVPGGDASVTVLPANEVLRELAPRALLRDAGKPAFRPLRLRIDARAQALMAVLRHARLGSMADTLEAECLALTLVRRSLAPRAAHGTRGGNGAWRLVHRAKLLLNSDPARRWTLGSIAAEVGTSPVYLTQVFQQVEGVPLYRYELRLRLARALALLPDYDDLTALGLTLGFSSHSHFSAAFRKTYGCTPSEFRGSTARGRFPKTRH